MYKRLLAVVAALLTLAFLASCGSKDSDSGKDSASQDSSSSSPSGSASDSSSAAGKCTYTKGGQAAKKAALPPSKPTVKGMVKTTITLNTGAVPTTLDAKSAPCTVNSFVSLAKQGYFDNTPCHRLTTKGIYVLQCGDPSGTGSGGPGYAFKDELSGSETYGPGTLAMANAGPNTNGSQFFIVYKNSPLPPSYTVFGKISQPGLKVVQAIAAKGSDNANGAGDGAPKQKVTIKSVK